MLVTLEVSQEFKGWLKTLAPLNTPTIDVTLEVSQLLKS